MAIIFANIHDLPIKHNEIQPQKIYIKVKKKITKPWKLLFARCFIYQKHYPLYLLIQNLSFNSNLKS